MFVQKGEDKKGCEKGVVEEGWGGGRVGSEVVGEVGEGEGKRGVEEGIVGLAFRNDVSTARALLRANSGLNPGT